MQKEVETATPVPTVTAPTIHLQAIPYVSPYSEPQSTGSASVKKEPATTAPDANIVYSGKDVTTKARVISKPEPQYTEIARQNQVTGTVVLRAVFTADGQVRNIRAVAGLPHGLTESN